MEELVLARELMTRQMTKRLKNQDEEKGLELQNPLVQNLCLI